jgi:protein-S-isoprenylcysteine O-methyltransferase Ste14
MSFNTPSQTGGATPPLVALAIIALFAVDDLAVRSATGTWQSSVFKLMVRDPSIVPIQITMAAGFVIALFAPRFAPALDLGGPTWIPATIGLILVAVGIALRAWAILTLGTSFSRAVRVEPDQPVVTNGPYRFARHPSYTGLLLAFTGIGVIVWNALSIAALALVPTIGLVIRILVEERALRSTLGSRYEDYARGRPRLIPGIW